MPDIDMELTGSYMAYPTTTELKPTYRKHKSMVNLNHTKVGITTDCFRKRSNEYHRTFNNEVNFIPLLAMPADELALIEGEILNALRNKYNNVGRTREWFDTSDREDIVQIISQIVGSQINSTLDNPPLDTAALIEVKSSSNRLSPKQLGDAGEDHALELLQNRGYKVEELRINAPTYDLKASKNGMEFLISVKVARDKQHVRLGSRRSVDRLEKGNFVFAFIPKEKGYEIIGVTQGEYKLLILPAEIAQTDSLSIHDPYWDEKGKDTYGFSVMVKGYGSHHRDMWPRWLEYANAWHLLP